ncbi:RNA-directed DNA polymerase [Dolichospermum sp. UHCC 0259]|uniref:RNA-directed DNA polymerase n=1 Tax=Dolichospermum sp. UHCC 0259 TaxID=2590010 RepID=UPI0014487BE6|nr:RNA-directed DNA polymerase [Dolichospermum sp. UHCC 0259]MTJ49029.1 Retron-type reverse transcriptase [Dolichospermum sp. UHCC 0259]
MKLQEHSLRWALNHLVKYSDTDLFPKPIEFDVLYKIQNDTINRLKDIDLGNYQHNAARRFIVPKDEISYRTATQLDPLDNIMLTAIIYEYGQLIENKRIPISEEKVFSYRFSPQDDWSLYNSNVSWTEFWSVCKNKISNYQYAVYLDIADFYNQIYHHNIENQLMDVDFPNQVKKWIINLLEKVTAKVSRGIPVGPHSTHLLGELSLIPLDNILTLKGLDFCRFVDDIVIFCNSYTESKTIIYQMAESLDKQQRLILQRGKTKIYNSDDFENHCIEMTKNQPINKYEEEILNIISDHSTGNPYVTIKIEDLSGNQLELFKEEVIENILGSYLNIDQPNYTRLRWFLRRLSQIGIPSAVEFCIAHIEILTPAISEVCHYLLSVNNNFKGNWKILGSNLFQILDNEIVRSNEYFQITILSLFSRNSLLNHSNLLITLYKSSPNSLRREILLSAYAQNMGDWIRELKEDYSSLDIWCKRAFIIASISLPMDERKFFLNHIKDNDILNELLIKWATAKLTLNNSNATNINNYPI